jgi:hypothetical protein
MYFLIDDWEYTIQGVGAFDVDKSISIRGKSGYNR